MSASSSPSSSPSRHWIGIVREKFSDLPALDVLESIILEDNEKALSLAIEAGCPLRERYRTIRDEDGRAIPLEFFALKCEAYSCLDILLDEFRSTLMRSRDSHGMSIFFYASSISAPLDAFTCLIDYEKKTHSPHIFQRVDNSGRTILHALLIMRAEHSIVRAVAQAFPSLIIHHDRFHCSPIHCASRSDDTVDILEFFLRLGRNCVNIDHGEIGGQTFLHEASSNGATLCVQTLLSHNATITYKDDEIGDTPLHMAARQGHIEVMRLLIRANRASIGMQNSRGETPSVLATRCATNTEGLEVLISERESILSEQDCQGFSLMHHAVMADAPKSVAFLYDADSRLIHGCDIYGRIPLFFAVAYNKARALASLLSYAEVLLQCRTSEFALLCAAVQNNAFDSLRELQQHGCNVGRRFSNGNTILHVHVSSKLATVQTVKQVVKFNDDLAYIRNNDELLPADIAINEEVREFLKTLMEPPIILNLSDDDENSSETIDPLPWV
jgi:ankyrin repeat protein